MRDTQNGSSPASVYRSVIVVGDSLSDNGNVHRETGEPRSPYFEGRFSNGPVAVEYLAALLNASLTDLAYGGATTGFGNFRDGGTVTARKNLPGMLCQVDSLSGTINPLESLVVVWGGGATDFLAPAPEDRDPGAVVKRATDNLLTIVRLLYERGARNFLIPGLPVFNSAPAIGRREFNNLLEASKSTELFNRQLEIRLQDLGFPARFFDTAALTRKVVANPREFGFRDVTAPLISVTDSDSDPAAYLFWDHFHPTTAAHRIMGEAFYRSLSPSSGSAPNLHSVPSPSVP